MTPSHDPDSLERSLRAVPPAGTPERLRLRIAAALGPIPANPHPQVRAGTAWKHLTASWLPWGIAAALAVALLVRGGATQAPRSTSMFPETPAEHPAGAASARHPHFTPVSTTNTLIGALDEGVITLDDGRPARKVRYEYVDTVNLRSADDPRTMVDVSFAREEIRLLPVQAF